MTFSSQGCMSEGSNAPGNDVGGIDRYSSLREDPRVCLVVGMII